LELQTDQKSYEEESKNDQKTFKVVTVYRLYGRGKTITHTKV